MNDRILFFDVDGVLNNHAINKDAQSCTLEPKCVREFNRILAVCEPRVVVSSAWRYLILRQSMTLQGFGHLLRTHGVSERIGRLLEGCTLSDEVLPTRGKQIEQWLHQYTTARLGVIASNPTFVVLDDAPAGMCFEPVAHRLVRTDGMVGLTAADADRVIAMLRRRESKYGDYSPAS